MESAYLWFKWLHLLALISWMAGLFYLPRLFVYHVECASDEAKKTFETMEYKLLKFIMTPAMLVTWVTGMLLIVSIGTGGLSWIWIKIALVVAMTGFHGFCGKWRKEFLEGPSERSGKFFRIANEVPTVLLVAIVGLVVFKPF